MLPIYWLRVRLLTRSRVILRALPDAVDLVVTTVEAGMSLDGALAEVGNGHADRWARNSVWR